LSQHRYRKPEKRYLAKVFRRDKKRDATILKVGKNVFPSFAKLNRRPVKLDTKVFHVGSMRSLHHTLTRGYLTAYRDFRGFKEYQLDLTASFGSSGGGVFLADGRLAGIVTSGYPQRLVFVTPLESLKELFKW
jgi:S1-C subfamily serine protease